MAPHPAQDPTKATPSTYVDRFCMNSGCFFEPLGLDFRDSGQSNSLFEGVCLNSRHPGPRRVLGRYRAAVRGTDPVDPWDPNLAPGPSKRLTKPLFWMPQSHMWRGGLAAGAEPEDLSAFAITCYYALCISSCLRRFAVYLNA